MSLVVIDDPLFREHSSPGHPERPARLDAIRAALEAVDAGAEFVESAPDAADEDILACHTREVLAAVESMSANGGGWFDADTYCGPASATAARRAAGAAMRAVDRAAAGAGGAGARPHALALTRPPGHHATRVSPMGFCLFNNIAIAARYAARARGVERLAIIDIDVHHGNGTQDIFYDDPDVLYVSLHEWPFYPGTGSAEERGAGSGEGYTMNIPLRSGTTAEQWLDALTGCLLPRVMEHRPELVLVSAGFDAHQNDPLANLGVTSDAYRRVAEEICAVAGSSSDAGTVWCLEGGYDLTALGESVAAVARVLSQA